MTDHQDDFSLALEYAPSQYPLVDQTLDGRWVELRRFGAGLVLATDDVAGISVFNSDLDLNPDHEDFPKELVTTLRVLRTAGHNVTEAFNILVKHSEYPVRGTEHRGRLAAARVLSVCIAHDPQQKAQLTVTFDAETERYRDVILTSVAGTYALHDGRWQPLDELELERRYDGFEVIDISAHGVAYVEHLLQVGRDPRPEDVRRFEGAADAPHPDHAGLTASATKQAAAPSASGAAAGSRTPCWYGDVHADQAPQAVLRLADLSKAGDWERVLALLTQNVLLTPNRWRPTGTSLYTPLHQAAWHGAPVEVVERLLELGAWRTLRTAEGLRAVDIARDQRNNHLIELLEPRQRRELDPDLLGSLDLQLARLVEDRIRPRLEVQLRHPTCEVLTEVPDGKIWYPVPGMYGGFAIQLRENHLYVESWSRVSGGSGRAHVVTAVGPTLVRSGFV